MKKIFILSFASVLLLTGCGATETLSCSYKNTADNGTTKINYDIDHEDDEIKKVRITYNYDFDNNTNDGTDNNNDMNNTNGVDTNNDTNGNNDVNNNTRNRDIDDVTDNNNTDLNGNNDVTGNNNNDVNDNDTTNNNINDTTNNNINGNNNNNITGYTTNDDNDEADGTDGVGTGTDGTTNDTQLDDDGIVDGIVGSAIDTIVGGVTGIILDSAGLRDRHANVQNTYGDVTGFSVQNTNDTDDNYKVTYVIDYDTISDDDLARFNLSRDLDAMRDNYVNQGFTCK